MLSDVRCLKPIGGTGQYNRGGYFHGSAPWGLRRWNTNMDIEYRYETFNGLPVYYGGDRYDSDGMEEFIPNAPNEMEYMTCTQRRLDGEDNRSVNTVVDEGGS